MNAAEEAAQVISERTGVAQHDIALTLGSGWAAAADAIGETVSELAATEVPGFAESGIPGHRGTLRSVRLADGRHALILGARTHLYENHDVTAVVHSVRVAAAAGVRTIVLTNGAGGIDPAFAAGEPVLISDHINLTAVSPLTGAHFVDLTDLYSQRLREIAREAAGGLRESDGASMHASLREGDGADMHASLREGVYVQLPGPHYETPAEIRYLRTIGGQLVGMSTALEAIAARAAGLEVLGLSLVTNPAAGLGDALSHDEVLAAGREAEPRLAALLAAILPRI